MLCSTPNSGSSCVGTEIAIINGLILIACYKTVSISFPYVTHDITTSTGQICKRHWRWKGSICNLSPAISIVYHCATIYPLYADSAEVLYSLLLSHNIFTILWRFHIFAMWQKPTQRKNHRTRLELECYGAWVRHASLLLQAPTYSILQYGILWPCETLTIVTFLHHSNSRKCFNIQFSVHVMPKHVCHPA